MTRLVGELGLRAELGCEFIPTKASRWPSILLNVRGPPVDESMLRVDKSLYKFLVGVTVGPSILSFRNLALEEQILRLRRMHNGVEYFGLRF